MQGTNAKTTLVGFDFSNVWITTDKTPALRAFNVEPVPPSEDELGYWNGTVATSFETGTGSETDPYIISKGSELAFAISSSVDGAYYKLSNDIYLNDVSNSDWASNSSNNEWFSAKNFIGNLDGDGHIVYGVWYPENNDDYIVGLIPVLQSSGSVKNIGVCNSVIVGQIAGAIVGMCKSNTLKTISCCFSDESVTVEGSENAAGILGYAGCATKGAEVTISIDNCYTTASITCKKAAFGNGIIGTSWLTAYAIENCYSIGSRPYNVADPGHKTTAAWNYNSSDGGAYRDGLTIADFIKNVYTDTGAPNDSKVWTLFTNTSEMQGTNAKTTLVGFDFAKVWTTTNSFPALRIFNKNPLPEPPTEEELGYWNGMVAASFEKGTGSEADPYVISKGSELALAIAASVEGTYYKLSNDIYLNDVSNSDWATNSSNNEWLSVKNFKGNLDGDGHIVYGIWYPENNDDYSVGLIPVLQSPGSVKNIGVCNSNIIGVHAGAIVGMSKGETLKTISACFSDDSVAVKGIEDASGILGYAGCSTKGAEVTVSINNCYTKAEINSKKAAFENGIIGTSWLTAYAIENCYSIGFRPYNVTDPGHKTTAAWNYNSSDGGALRDGVKIDDFIKNVYTDTGAPNDSKVWTVYDNTEELYGETAKTSMSGLDFENVFEVCVGATPKLKIFKDYIGDYYGPSFDDLAYGGGKGTEADPYLIKNEEQLRYLVQSKKTKNKYYQLTNNIKVTGEWYFTSDNSMAFAGYIEGNGFTISCININETPAEYNGEWFASGGAGLFPYITTSATIRNIHIRHSNISGKAYTGAIAGFIKSENDKDYAEITGCSVDESVTIKGQTVGGLIGGGARGLIICYSYSTANLSNSGPEEQLGSIVGDIWSSDYKVYNCYSVGPKNFRADKLIPTYRVAIYGTTEQRGTIALTKEQMLGTAAKQNMTELDWNYWYVIDNDTPHIRVIPAGVGITESGVKGRVWSGKLSAGYAGGSGTQADPYLIETPEQLAYLVFNSSTSKGNYYKLTADIKLNDTTKSDWEKNAKEWFSGWLVFSGYFDGNGHVVSGLYFDTEYATYTALFPVVSEGVVIERLGVEDSTIINVGDAKNHTYAAAINALVSYKYDGTNTSDMPIFRECFVGKNVYVKGYFAGGIACGCGAPLYMENCYSICTVVGEQFFGGLVGNAWCDDLTIKNCYAATANRDNIGLNYGFDSRGNFANVYVDGSSGKSTGVKKLGLKLMQGSIAPKYMVGLDFNNIWLTVNGGTPVLRCFENAEQYTSKREAEKITISFASFEGTKCESIYGYAGYTPISEDKLPVPTRAGYAFGGWYHFSDLTCPFSIDVFPNQNAVLYAKWIPLGFKVDFEKNIDPKYDVNEGAERLAPGSTIYSTKYKHSGVASMRCKADATMNPLFLLSYENTLEIGKEYTISFWMTTKESNVSGLVELLHANHPQVDSDVVGFESAFEFSGTIAGEWKQYTYTFVANTPYLLIRTSQGSDIFFDDIEVTPTGNDGELGKLQAFESSLFTNGNENILIFVIVTSIVIIAIAGVVVVVLIKKHKKIKEA